MKTTILKSVFLFTITALFLSSCVNDDQYAVPNLDCTETNLVKTKEVLDIPASLILTQYTQDEVIEAYVTSSDEGGNFFKSISFQTLDGSKAFSVPVDVTSTFVNFNPGRKVLIKMKNLYTDLYNDGARFGSIYVSPSTGEAAVGRLSLAQYKSVLNRSCASVSEDDLVLRPTLIGLKNDFYINKLVEIDNIQFDDTSVGVTYYDEANEVGGATNRIITDAFGSKMIFRTSSFANFANRISSNKSGKIRGVLTKFGSDYQFLARTERDIMLTEDRFAVATPFLTEDFNSAVDGTNLDIPNWVNFAESGTKVWKEEVFSGNGYTEFSAFASTNSLNVSWLISPSIDFSAYTNKVVKFDIAQHHLDVDAPGNSLQVLVSTDFDGVNVLAATWTQVNANIPVKATSWYTFLPSVIDLSSYSGNVYVAFKFTGSGTNTTLDGAFQVDNFKALGL